MSFIAKKLREDRFKLVSDAQNLIENDKASGEDLATFDSMMVEADRMMEHIKRVEQASSERAKLEEIIGASAEQTGVSFGQKENEVERFKKGFVAAMRHGAKLNLSAQDKAAFADYQNAAGSGGTAGGYTIPTDLMRQIYAALVLEGGVRQGATIMRTDQGNPIDMPMNDDTGNIGAIVAENTSLGTATDLVFSKVTLGAIKYTSGVALISKELLQDSAFDFEQFLQGQLVHRLARATNAHYTTGNGTTQPQGIITAASSGTVGTTGQTTSIIYPDLVNLEHSVAWPYRRSAKWMMSDAMFKTIKRLVDTQGRPLWLPSLTVGAPDSLLGYDIIVNADMAVPAANAKSLLFGDSSQFIIRDVLDLNFQVLNELYAATGQVGVVGLMRTDSKLASVGACLKYYANSAT
jgi:HK97 family phage major capsid protein